MLIVYQTRVSIPEFSAKAGDFICFEPTNHRRRVTVSRPIPEGLAPILLEYLEQLDLVAMDPPVLGQSPREVLKAAVGAEALLARLQDLPVPEPWPGPPTDE